MLLELLATTVLWSSFDKDARLEVNCNSVAIFYGGKPQAEKRKVHFWFVDRQGQQYSYIVAMPVGPQGQIFLEPTEYWIEEIKEKRKLNIEIENHKYTFKLNGSSHALQCNK